MRPSEPDKRVERLNFSRGSGKENSRPTRGRQVDELPSTAKAAVVKPGAFRAAARKPGPRSGSLLRLSGRIENARDEMSEFLKSDTTVCTAWSASETARQWQTPFPAHAHAHAHASTRHSFHYG